MTREQIENKFKVVVADDSFIHPISGRYVRMYKIYSADGCQWENGLRSLKAVYDECKEWEETLAKIAKIVEENSKKDKVM